VSGFKVLPVPQILQHTRASTLDLEAANHRLNSGRVCAC
jgi:hypothetical protein